MHASRTEWKRGKKDKRESGTGTWIKSGKVGWKADGLNVEIESIETAKKEQEKKENRKKSRIPLFFIS